MQRRNAACEFFLKKGNYHEQGRGSTVAELTMAEVHLVCRAFVDRTGGIAFACLTRGVRGSAIGESRATFAGLEKAETFRPGSAFRAAPGAGFAQRRRPRPAALRAGQRRPGALSTQ